VTLLRRWKRHEGGQAAVEFALVLPLLLVMLIGIVEFGRAWNSYQVITDAARETARRACLGDVIGEDAARQVAKDAMIAAGINPDIPGHEAEIDFPSDPPTVVFDGDSNTLVIVNISLPFQFTFFGPLVKWATGKTNMVLETSFTMRNE
jgi:Flp pilus assembly pilin Flp